VNDFPLQLEVAAGDDPDLGNGRVLGVLEIQSRIGLGGLDVAGHSQGFEVDLAKSGQRRALGQR
jgi:hypothetical protein